MLDEYKFKQEIAYKILNSAIENNKLSHAYLFDSNFCSYAYDFVLSFVKNVICKDLTDTVQRKDICKLIDDGNYLDVRVIEADGMWIKKEQMINLQDDFNKKSFDGNKKIYIIKAAEKMNTATANSILKFLEEPVDDIMAILITDNINLVLPTILSRCQIIKLVGNGNLIDSMVVDLNIDDDTKNQIIAAALSFATVIENEKFDAIVYAKQRWHSFFKDRNYNILGVEILINLYYDILRFKNCLEILYFKEDKELIEQISSFNTDQQIENKILILNSIKNDFKYNLNINLLVDRMIIEMCGDINEISWC